MIKPLNIDQFIEQLQQIDKEKRKLPLLVPCPNGLMVEPKIKMQFEPTDQDTLSKSSKVSAMVITY